MNWLELKNWLENQVKENSNLNFEQQLALNMVREKMEFLENQNFFTAYTDFDGMEFIVDRSEEGVSVWTDGREGAFVVKVPKSSVRYFDEENNTYECNTVGLEILHKIDK